ncbi:MAG: hypothetical protein ABI460_01205 [Caldimonas sp.]
MQTSIAESPARDRGVWVNAFVAYLLEQSPLAPARRVVEAAHDLYTRLGEFDPIDVAEAEWNELPIH